MTTGKNLNDKENLLLILTGRGGSADGFGNKYGKIRDRVREKYGFSVYIVRTPQDVWERKNTFFEEAVSAVIQYRQIYMMGVSAGASIALWYAAGYPQIVRVLAVNPVLQINFDMALSGMRRFRGERLNVVVGDETLRQGGRKRWRTKAARKSTFCRKPITFSAESWTSLPRCPKNICSDTGCVPKSGRVVCYHMGEQTGGAGKIPTKRRRAGLSPKGGGIHARFV